MLRYKIRVRVSTIVCGLYTVATQTLSDPNAG